MFHAYLLEYMHHPFLTDYKSLQIMFEYLERIQKVLPEKEENEVC